jgi:hypothetical protein
MNVRHYPSLEGSFCSQAEEDAPAANADGNWIDNGCNVPPPLGLVTDDLDCLMSPRSEDRPSYFLDRWLMPDGPSQAVKRMSGELRRDPKFLLVNLLQLEQWTQYEHDQLVARAYVKNRFLEATITINDDDICAQFISEDAVRTIARGAFKEQIRLHDGLVMFADDGAPEQETLSPETRSGDIVACRTKWQLIRRLLDDCVDLVQSWDKSLRGSPQLHLLPHADEGIFTYDFETLEDSQAVVYSSEGTRDRVGQEARLIATMEYDALASFRVCWGRNHHELGGVFCIAARTSSPTDTCGEVTDAMYPALVEAYHKRRLG